MLGFLVESAMGAFLMNVGTSELNETFGTFSTLRRDLSKRRDLHVASVLAERLGDFNVKKCGELEDMVPDRPCFGRKWVCLNLGDFPRNFEECLRVVAFALQVG